MVSNQETIAVIPENSKASPGQGKVLNFGNRENTHPLLVQEQRYRAAFPELPGWLLVPQTGSWCSVTLCGGFSGRSYYSLQRPFHGFSPESAPLGVSCTDNCEEMAGGWGTCWGVWRPQTLVGWILRPQIPQFCLRASFSAWAFFQLPQLPQLILNPLRSVQTVPAQPQLPQVSL